MASKIEWVVNAQQRKTWTAQFATLSEESGQGAVTGEQLKKLLAGTGLPTTVLAQIWTLSAKPGSKTLGEEEFLICSFLVSVATRGATLPSTLPKEFLKSLRKPAKDSAGSVTPPSASPPPAASSPPSGRIKTSKKSSDSPEKSKRATIRTSGSSQSVNTPSGASSTPVESSAASGSPSTGAASGSTKKRSKWALTKEQKRRYIETFNAWASDGLVSGEQAVRLFSQSGLPRQDLASIWALSDMDRDTMLSQQEFCIAMALIARRMQGDALPATVPTALVLSASSDLMSSKRGPKGLNRAGASSGITRGSRETTQVPQRSLSMVSPTTAAAAAPTRSTNVTITTVPVAPGPGEVASGVDEFGQPRGLQRSASSAQGTTYATGLQEDLFARQPMQPTTVGVGNATSYSASELPNYEYSMGASAGIRPLSYYGVDERPILAYDSTADVSKLDEIADLATMQAMMNQLNEEMKMIAMANDKALLQQETLKVKLESTSERNSITERRRNNFDTILSNYNQQLDSDMSLYASLKAELNEISSDIETQQQQLSSPQYDLSAVRERRRALQAEYSKVRAQATASHEEHNRLVAEVEKLRAAGAEQAAAINTDWSDHGFKEEPVVAFGDGDFGASASTASIPGANFTPSFQGFKASSASFNGSGTITPAIDDWDYNEAETDEPADNMAWLTPEFATPGGATSPGMAPSASNADFFASESANWANFSVQEDDRRRERAASVSVAAKDMVAPKPKKSPAAKKEAKAEEKPKKKKKKEKS